MRHMPIRIATYICQFSSYSTICMYVHQMQKKKIYKQGRILQPCTPSTLHTILPTPSAHPIASPHTHPNTPPLTFASPHPHRPPALRTLKTFFRPKSLLPPRLASRLVGCTRFSLLPAYMTGSNPVGLRISMYVCR